MQVNRGGVRLAALLLPFALAACVPAEDEPEDGCPVGTEQVGESCAPAAGTCESHEIPMLGGGCLAAGVPDGGCAAGWIGDDAGGCTAPAHLGACTDGEMAVPGDDACRSPMPCGEGRWGDIPTDSETLYVDAAYVGGDADGSETRPFRRISDAIAAAGGGAPLVAVAAGTYDENLQIFRRLRIHGRCPELVHLRGNASFIVNIDRAVELRGLSITGSGVGIGIGVGGDVMLSGLRIHDTGDYGIYVENPDGIDAEVTLEDVLVDRATGIGIAVVGATAVMEALEVRRTREVHPGWGRGMHVAGDEFTGGRASLQLSRAVISENFDAGVFVTGSDATVARTLVRATRARPSDDLARGIAVQDNTWSGSGHLELSDSLVMDNEDFGLYVSGSDAYVTQSTFTGNRYSGLAVWGGVLDVASSAIRSTRARATDGTGGVGLAGAYRETDGLDTSLRISGSLVEDMRVGGVHLFGAWGEIEDTVVRGVVARTATDPAGGLIGLARPDRDVRGMLQVTRSRIAEVEGAGVLARGLDVELEATVIHGIRPTPDGRFGDGLAIGALPFTDASGYHPASAGLNGVRFDDNARAGASVFGAALTVEGSWLTCSSFDLNVERRFHADFEADFVLEDRGENVCGCGERLGSCQAASEGLEPAEAPPMRL